MGWLKLICEEKLCEYIHVGTVANIMALVEQHCCEGLKKACFDFFAAPEKFEGRRSHSQLLASEHELPFSYG